MVRGREDPGGKEKETRTDFFLSGGTLPAQAAIVFPTDSRTGR